MHFEPKPSYANGNTRLKAIIIGTGFSGIGMAVQLKKHGITDFVILERRHDVGGVWRDNSYPGAACDVPSHLYSFSFEPNPHWSHVFAAQPEIHEYLKHCARKYDILSKIVFGADVTAAHFDESRSVWQVILADGTTFKGDILISGTGQLSRPAYPAIEGSADFKGKIFHSAHWDHDYSLEGKHVAVVGTGASAIQFVPAIAKTVKSLALFQRSPPYIMPRPDRAYSAIERWIFQNFPSAMRLYRASIYVRYESRAIAFTRLKGLMSIFVGRPFRRLLNAQVQDASLRAKLTPSDPIGCKRVLLSSEYYSAVARQNVTVMTKGIRRIYANGVETVDGQRHDCDTIIFGTGFAATEFLTPMQVYGRGGINLNDAWRNGAMGYLGLSVPDFPNFFMLYGPNTNLGHNSIVYMLESQIAHVIACLKYKEQKHVQEIEIQPEPYKKVNLHVQKRLAHTVWNGCKSWYIDANGHNSTNWPGFTFTYRWLVKRANLSAYRFTTPLDGAPNTHIETETAGRVEKLTSGGLRNFLKITFKPLIGPPFPAGMQRFTVALLSPFMPGVPGPARTRVTISSVICERVTPVNNTTAGAILYLHGGAFCLGGPQSHRSITTRLAEQSGMQVIVPDYRLAPEHPWPAGLDDAAKVYSELMAQGLSIENIILAGDSAGGSLALDLAIKLRKENNIKVAGLALISPVVRLRQIQSDTDKKITDPMIRAAWLKQATSWYRGAAQSQIPEPLAQAPALLPPIFIQVGRDEILLKDSLELARHAEKGGRVCKLEIYEGRWHVFHLQSFWMKSGRHALSRLAEFARIRATHTCTYPTSDEIIMGRKLDKLDTELVR